MRKRAIVREGNKERDKKTVEGGSPGFVVMGEREIKRNRF